ncbi:MAG TPA: tyrosinase family protein [Nitrospiraceae bacterium]|nr:tyrosinase family protein [Nitrospiraceae bacterium]
MRNENEFGNHPHRDEGVEKETTSRREFLAKAGLMAGGVGLLSLTYGLTWAVEPQNCAFPRSSTAPVSFQPDRNLAVRTRKSASTLTATEVQRLKAAYTALRRLSSTRPNDSRGWLRQANAHCWYCGGGLNGRAGEEIHGGWWFLPWHRCYLYFHERILGNLIGDPTLTLPYWDWDRAAGRTIPAAYTNPNTAANPLFDANRGRTPTATLPTSIVGSQVMAQVLAAPTSPLFMGSDASSPNSQGGRLENGPHGAVHIWTGTSFQSPQQGQDMGILSTAAQDPVFFAHHANIDRLWDVWLQSSNTHQNPTDSAWLTHRWTFYDERGRRTSISVADVVDAENSLRYRYDDVAPKAMAMDEREAESRVTLGPNAITKTIPVPDELHAKIMKGKAADEPAREYVLHIEDVHFPQHRSAIVHVFGNLPRDEKTAALSSDRYLGYFAIVPRTTKDTNRKAMHRHIVLQVSERIRDLLKASKELSVTLAPVTAEGKPSPSKMAIGKLYLAED